MALSAKFVADFSSFYDAVQKADVSLKGFDTSANKVNSSLARMTDAFSGRRLIQEATVMERAIAELGGVSKLTDGEMKRLTQTIGAAADKMKAMGGGGEGVAAFQKAIASNTTQTSDSFKALFTNVEKTTAASSKAADQFRATFTEAPKQVKQLDAAVAPMPDSFDSIKSAVLGAGGALGIAFSGTAILSGIKAQIDAAYEYGSAIANMSARTSIGVVALQKLEAIGVTSGVSMQDLAGAVNVLQQRINDPKALEALRGMGLNYQNLRNLRPEDQFTQIARAISQIENPIDRANAGAAIFKNTWTTIAPAITKDMQTVIDQAKTLSAEQIAALDKNGAGWSTFFHNFHVGVMGLIADYELGQQAYEKQTWSSAWTKTPAATPTLPAAPPMRVGNISGFTGSHVTSFVDPSIISDLKVEGMTLDETTKHTEQLTVAQKAATKAREDFLAMSKAGLGPLYSWQTQILLTKFKTDQLTVSETQLAESVGDFADFVASRKGEMFPEPPPGSLDQWKKTQKTIKETKLPIDETTKSLEGLAQSFVMMAQASNGAMGGVAKDIGGILTSMHAAEKSGQAMKAGFEKGGVAGYGAMAEGAIGAIGAIDAATNSGNKAIAVMGGMAAGAKAGMAFGPYGAAIGAAAGAITGFVKANSHEGKFVSPLRDAFFDMAGGLEVLNPRVEQLTGNLTLVQAVFDAKTVEQYNAAIGELNNLFKQEQDALALLTETADRYGFTIEELGPAMQRQKLDKQAQQLFKDWEVLNAAGIDTVAITSRMASGVNDYVGQALKMGTEVPEAMRPMLTQMAQMGQLTDANGNKIENLESSGLTFSMTMSEGFNKLIGEVQKLADVLTRSLGGAVDQTQKQIAKFPTKIPIEVAYKTTGDVPKGASASVPGYQGGTHGKFVDFGAGSLVMLHGKEAVVPQDETGGAELGASSATGGGSGGSGVTVHIDARGALFNDPGSDQRLAAVIERALSARHGLTHRRRAA